MTPGALSHLNPLSRLGLALLVLALWNAAAGSAASDEREDRLENAREALRFHAQKRAPHGQQAVPSERYQPALAAMRQMPVFSSARNEFLPGRGRWTTIGTAAAPDANLGTWSYLGPGNIGGRTRALVFHPDFASNQTLYAGGVAGGVWRSTDAGGSWMPIGDAMANLAVSALVLSPGDPSTIYAGTGEGFHNFDAVRGNGIFKTTDGGGTWSQLASTNGPNFRYVHKLATSALHPANLYAATNAGLLRSTDAGASWSAVLLPGDTPGTSSVYPGDGCV